MYMIYMLLYNAETLLKLDRQSARALAEAKPYSELPGPSKFEFMRYFMPGGK